MAHHARDPRLVDVPPEHREFLGQLQKEYGTKDGAAMAHVGRTAFLSVIATGMCMPGTAALIRESFATRKRTA
jgi:hypothetical protein